MQVPRCLLTLLSVSILALTSPSSLGQGPATKDLRTSGDAHLDAHNVTTTTPTSATRSSSLSVFSGAVTGVDEPTAEAALDADPTNTLLKTLPPLPSIHAAWARGMPIEHYEQISRILGSCNIDGKWGDTAFAWQYSAAQQLGYPTMLHYSPDHRVPDDRPGGIEHFRVQLQKCIDLGLPLWAVILDAESMSVNRETPQQVYDFNMTYYNMVQQVRPGTRVEWYQHKGMALANNYLGWTQDDNTAGIEPGNYAVSIYRPWEVATSQEQITRTAELYFEATKKEHISIWFALGGGYVRTVAAPLGKWQDDASQLGYTDDIAWLWGNLLHSSWHKRQDPARFGRIDQVEFVIFYPSPMSTEARANHFVSYVKGANNIKE